MRGIIGEAFAEARVERGRFSFGIEMRDVAKARGTHEGNALSALLRIDRGDRGGQSAGMLPERIGRAMHQVRHDHGDHAEVAKDRDRVVVRATAL